MATLLRRSNAPITDEAWKQIDETAVRVLKANLSARSVVDVSGPHGWDYAAVNTGRLEIPKEQKTKGVNWGVRTVQPLIEVRVPFFLQQFELDYINRGAKDADLSALEEAAKKTAVFEETAVYKGFAPAGMKGIIGSCAHKPMTLTDKAEDFIKAVAGGILTLQEATVGGPFTLVLGSKPYRALMENARSGYPLRKAVRDILGGEVHWSPALDGGVLLSTRGGDLQMTLGVDLAVGFWDMDREKVELFFTESFTFRVIEPAAAVVYKVG
jgi:uncharacterized linocin/CFP29 family protein